MIILLAGEEVTAALNIKRREIIGKIVTISKTGNDKDHAELPALSAGLVKINEMLQNVVAHRTYEIIEYVTAAPAKDAAELLDSLTDNARQVITDELRPGGRLHAARNPDAL